jgi:hypothetical protein
MAVVLIKAQFRAGPGRAEVSGVILAVMVASATDARQIPVPVPDKFVESVLRLLDEITQGFTAIRRSAWRWRSALSSSRRRFFSFRCFSALAASLAALPCTQAHSYEQTYCSDRTG